MQIIKVLSFVNACRSGRMPDIFIDYDKARDRTGTKKWHDHGYAIGKNRSGSKPLWYKRSKIVEYVLWYSELSVTQKEFS